MVDPEATSDPAPWRSRANPPRLRLLLIIALALHAALLLIPVHRSATEPERSRVEVTLASPAPATTVAMPEPAPRVSSRPIPPVTGPLAAAQPKPRRIAAQDQQQPPSPPAVSTAYLLEVARDMRWQQPPVAPHALGTPRITELPANLARPLLPLAPNAFDPYVAPTSTEVVDHWLEPGGAQRVVIRTPSGETYCGRRESWDPLNPLFEPVMMFHGCAGGGRRQAKAPPFQREG